jgi:hypothetical protein
VTDVPILMRWEPQHPSDRYAYAVIDVHDTGLALQTSVTIPASQTWSVHVPESSVLYARGWLPRGLAFESTFDSARVEGESVILRPVHVLGPAPSRMSAATWLIPWVRRRDRWLPSAPCHSLRLLDDLPVSAAPGETVAVQLGDPDGPSVTVLAPVSTRLSSCGQPIGAEGPDLLGWSLLEYLHAGDLRAGRVVGDELAALRGDEQAASGLVPDLALGYLWAATGDDRIHKWARRLRGEYGRSADARILSAWSRLQQQSPDRRLVRDLVAAAESGGPIVARGLRLLADGLTSCAVVDDTPQVRRALERVGSLQRSIVSNMLTTYAALTPNVPMPLRTFGQASVEEEIDVGVRLQPIRKRGFRQRSQQAAIRLHRAAIDAGIRQLSIPLVAAPDETLLTAAAAQRVFRRIGSWLTEIPAEAPVQQALALENLADHVMSTRSPLSRRAVLGLRRSFLDAMQTAELDLREDLLWRPERPSDGVWRIPRFSLTAARLASQRDDRPTSSHRQPDLGCTVTLVHSAQRRVEIRVHLERAATDPVRHLAELQVATYGLDEVVLIPLSPAEPGVAGVIHLDGVRHWVQTAMRRVVTADELTPADTDAIEMSVRLTDRQGRNAWRAIARQHGSDAVATAVDVGIARHGETG